MATVHEKSNLLGIVRDAVTMTAAASTVAQVGAEGAASRTWMFDTSTGTETAKPVPGMRTRATTRARTPEPKISTPSVIKLSSRVSYTCGTPLRV